MGIKPTIVFLTYIPAPYRVDFFNELSKVSNLYVVYYNKGMKNAGWKKDDKKHNYKKTFLFEIFKFQGVLKLLKILFKNRNEIIVIGGYAKFAEIIAIIFLRLFNVDFILNSDGGFITDVGKLKSSFKGFLIRSAKYWISSGINTTKTLIHYGANTQNIYEYRFTSLIKNEVLKAPIKKDRLLDLRTELNLKPDTTYYIFVGRLIEGKGVNTLLEAINLMNHQNFELLIIGEGYQLNDLKNYSRLNNLDKKVHFLGKLSKVDVIRYLRISDLFIFPSQNDVWGLVLNEAISNGLPVISTKQVGASYSLIKENENGYMINADSPLELAEILNSLNHKDLSDMKLKSIEIAQDYNIENMVRDHMKLISKITQEKSI